MVNNMRRRINKDKLFDIIIGILMGIIALIFLLPLIHVLACSFSDADEVLSGNVGLFPVEFSLDGYKKFLKKIVYGVDLLILYFIHLLEL